MLILWSATNKLLYSNLSFRNRGMQKYHKGMQLY